MHELRQVRIARELFLASVGLTLEEVEIWVLERMTSMLEEQFFRAGDTLFSSGEPCDRLLFFGNGKVRLTHPSAPPWRLEGRWFLGVFEAVGDLPYYRTATALTDFAAMRMPRNGWLDLLEDSFVLSRSALENMSRSIEAFETRVPESPPNPGSVVALPQLGKGLLSLAERLAILVNIPMFSGAGVQALAELAGAAVETTFAEGETVLPRAVERRALVVVVDGEVVASRTEPEVRRRYGAGEVVFAAFAFGSPSRSWEACAASPLRTLSLPYDLWMDLMEEHFDVLRAAIGSLGVRRNFLFDCMAQKAGELVLT